MTIMKTGIPNDVYLYHPIEFLELSKGAHAFFDMNLIEPRGGIQNQLLIGHLVHFIQNSGIESFKDFDYCRQSYLDELIQKMKEKGLEVESLKSKFYINWDRTEKLSDSKLIYQTVDPFDQAANIFSSSNYKQFHKFEFNRKTSKKHSRRIADSIRRNGITSYPLIIYTDIIDGEPKYYIVDGQHRCEAFEILGLPIWFTLYTKRSPGPTTMYDLVRLVSDVNNTSKPWNIHQYLLAWKSLKIREYEKIYLKRKEVNLPINILLQSYSGHSRKRAITDFVDGKYKMLDEANGDIYVKYLADLQSEIKSKSTAFLSGLVCFFREEGENYDNEKMINAVKKSSDFNFGEKTEEIDNNIKMIYNKW